MFGISAALFTMGFLSVLFHKLNKLNDQPKNVRYQRGDRLAWNWGYLTAQEYWGDERILLPEYPRVESSFLDSDGIEVVLINCGAKNLTFFVGNFYEHSEIPEP